MFTDADGINWFLTALFNPGFLGFLLLTYFLGKYIGKLTVNLNVWKVLALCYLGVFLYPALITDITIITVVFGLGVLSNHRRLIFEVLFWARDLGDLLFAFRHRAAFRDIRAAESAKDSEIERLKRELDEARRAAGQNTSNSSGQSQTQENWRRESAERRGRSYSGGGDDRNRERGGGSRSRSGGNTGSAKRRKPAGEKEKSRSKGSSSSSRGSSSKRSSNQGSNSRRSTGSSSSTNTNTQTRSSDPARDRNLAILGLKPGDYNPDELKAAWRKMAKKTHPDAGGSMAAFIEVKNAYDALLKN